MYSKFQLAIKYLKYNVASLNGKGHGTHSPFVFHFITRILNDKKKYEEYAIAEQLRNQLLQDKTVLKIEDYGAGSVVNNTNFRTVGAIAKSAAKPKKYGQLLFRMVKEYKPEKMLELGTSLGITSSYLALGNREANIITMEGANEVAEVAHKNFQALGFDNIRIEKGNFDETLSSVLSQMSSLDFVFIDGNHRNEPTVRYFKEMLLKVNNDTIMIFDDIHWSKEMENAWSMIKNHSAVSCTIDLFFIGIVLFRKEFFTKQHFTIRF